MPVLTTWKFDTVCGAGEALSTLRKRQMADPIPVFDAAAVRWPSDAARPQTEQLHTPSGPGAFGTVFCIAVLAARADATAGPLSPALTDLGVGDDFIATTRDEIVPGTSMLFVLGGDAVADRIRTEISPPHSRSAHRAKAL